MRHLSPLCFVVMAVAVLLGCSPSSIHQPAATDVAAAAPTSAELEQLLQAELDRLGVDRHKHARSAPSGPENSVINLSAFVVDPDGNGPLAPTAVNFSWTERSAGDYNQDGLVGVSDLTPLGVYFERWVQYDDPALHAGIESWPTGDPLDDGGVNPGDPPAAGSGAENWRLARVDGNRDGLITVSDITPIAQNWQHWLDGYRVYRRRPGETEFTKLPHPSGPASALSVTRGDISTDPLYPVCYTYDDEDLGPATGVYEYYVAPYDGNDDEDGEPSTVLLVDLDAGGGGSQAPIAVLTADVYSGTPPLSVNFDAAASYDPDPGGTIAKYEWDTDGDPSTWELDSGTDPTYATTYTTASIFEQWVRVTDLDGMTGEVFVTIDASGGNELPVADLTAIPATGTAPINVHLSAIDSYDSDGNIVQYEFDPKGDGTWLAPQTSYQTSHFFDWGGTYNARVRVTDDMGATDIATATITLDGPPQQHAPVADLQASPLSGEAPLEVTLDASGSTDADGDIAFYQWDLDGDGMFIDDMTLGPVKVHVFTEVGTFNVGVRVQDSEILTADDEAFVQIEILPGSEFWHIYPADIVTGGHMSHVSLAEVNGQPALAYTRLAGNIYDVYYVRATDALGKEWGTPFSIAGGMFKGRASTLAVINGHPAVSYYWGLDAYHGYLMFTRADNADGDLWLSPVFVAGIDDPIEVWANSLAEINGRPAMAVREVKSDSVLYWRATDADGSVWPDAVEVLQGDKPGYDCKLLTVGSRPAICHIRTLPFAVVYYQRAANGDGTNWTGEEATEATFVGNGYGGRNCSAAVIDGNPAVCYYDHNGQFLRFVRAADATGASWGDEQILDETLEAGWRCQLIEAGGRACIVYVIESTNELAAIQAADSAATSWLPKEIILESAIDSLSATEVNGRPAAAYNRVGAVYYAVRY